MVWRAAGRAYACAPCPCALCVSCVLMCVYMCARRAARADGTGRLADRPWGEDVLSLGRWTRRRQAHRPADVIVLSRLPACLLRCGQRDGCTPKAEGAAALGGGESTYVSRWRANGSSRLSNGRRQTADSSSTRGRIATMHQHQHQCARAGTVSTVPA